jgi:hypothetical protein
VTLQQLTTVLRELCRSEIKDEIQIVEKVDRKANG